MQRTVFLLLAIGISFFTTEILAQAPHVISVSPSPQAVNALAEAEVVVIFDTPLDTPSISGQTFRVFGKWSGPASGIFSFSDNNMEIHFLPDENFFAGELVMVQLSKGIMSNTGENLEAPYAWTYWIVTAPGVLNQPTLDTIELRLPYEGLIQTYGTYAGDMNNDGFSDLVVVNETSDDLRILLNDGQGGYSGFTIYDTGADGTPSPNEGADFNNDGEIDFVVTTAWSNEVRVLTGDGQGNFSNMETYYTSNGVRGVVVGDFDGDGWDDMLTTNRLDGNISIFMNDGDGTFTASGMDVPNEDETACSIADINNDGILDVFYAAYNSEKVGVLLGDGTGGFMYETSVSVLGRPWMISAGDFNGDGNADVASVNYSTDKTAVLFGDGLGGLSAPVHYSPADADFPLAIDPGDLDGDGDLDFVTSNHNSGNFNVFENDGTGQFTVAATLPSLEAGSCATLHDRDNDGDLDITGADEDEDVLLLFDNSGAPSASIILADYDLCVTAYPNPASTTLTVAMKNRSDELMTTVVYDLSGKMLANYSCFSGNAAVIPLNGFEDGMYLLKLETRQGTTLTSPFVISR